MRKVVVALIFALSLLGASLSAGTVRAEEADCAKGPNAFARSAKVSERCARNTVATRTKSSAADTYDSYLKGQASLEQVRAADARVSEVTGARIPDPVDNLIARGNDTDPYRRPPPEHAGVFRIFEQINEYFCGPATAQSILHYFGSRDSRYLQAATWDDYTWEQNFLTGEPRDQVVLANDAWLATVSYYGTMFGRLFMPYTLNAWRGDSYYTQGVTTYGYGPIDKDQFLRMVRYDVDRGFPVAENVMYNADSYYPVGFDPNYDYEHWDVVYGHFTVAGRTFVQVGQTYASHGYGHTPYQAVLLDTHWTALQQWFGIVW